MPQTPSFVLRRVEYGDRDIIVTFLSPKPGKFSALAKNARGSRKRFGGGLEPMRCLSIDYSTRRGRDFGLLKGIELIEQFESIEESYEHISVSSYGTELVREMTPEGPAPVAEPTFELLRQFYRQLDGQTDLSELKLTLANFELRLLALQGARPAVSNCFRCGTSAEKMDKIRAIRRGQGVICRDCLRPNDQHGVLARETFEILTFLADERDSAPSVKKLDDSHLTQLRRFIDTSIHHFLGKKLDSRAMLDAL